MNAPIIGTIEIPRLTKLQRDAERRGRKLFDLGRSAYLASLGVVATAQDEGTRAYDKLVARSERTLDTLVARGETLEKKREHRMAELRDDLIERRDAVVERIDDVVRPATRATSFVVQRVGMPTREEVRDLAHNVAALSRKVDALVTQLGEIPAVAVEPTITVASADEGWAVQVEGTANVLSVHPTKDEAVDAGRALATERAPSHLIVYKKDGTIQDKVSYHA